jgi:hypothetical protein
VGANDSARAVASLASLSLCCQGLGVIVIVAASAGTGLATVVGLCFAAWAGWMVTFAVKLQRVLPWGICWRLRRGRGSVTRRIS